MLKFDAFINATGSTCCPVEMIPDKELESMRRNSKYFFLTRGGKRYITFNSYYQKELKIAQRIAERTRRDRRFDNVDLDFYIDRFEQMESATMGIDFKLAKEQREAVKLLLTSYFAVLTGGPGTGKTSVLKCVAQVIKWQTTNATIRFLAPTGKAARRVTESSGYPATTVQSSIGDGGSSYMAVTDDYIIVDEISMLDVETMVKFLNLAGSRSHIYLVGDVDQLPSVGKGAVLRDIIDSRSVPVCQLERIFRQKEGSTLADNIEIIKKGGYCNFKEGNDFLLHENVEDMLDIYFKESEYWGKDNVIILTPTRKAGQFCSENLNRLIQQRLNPRADGIRTSVKRDGRYLDIEFRVGDPVMQLQNREIANGEVGKVIRTMNNIVTVEYSDCIISYRVNDLWQLDLAYAISIHKSQGSEYPCALVLCEGGNLDRNMIYTGVTRAKKKCIVLGKEESILQSCKKQSTWERITMLCHLTQTYVLSNRIRRALAKM